MSTTRWWDPSTELAQTHRMMDRLFEGFFGAGGDGTEGQERLPTYFMPVDILETEDSYTLYGAVPGFDPEKVEVTFDEGILTIQANPQTIPAGGTWLRRERPHGSFVRRLQLPTEVQAAKIAATFENGVLTVTVPKAPRPQPVKIPVGAAGTQSIEATNRR
ncbi:MAG: hypothetical protein NVS9B1_04150 [Candidatus Dormibacteraceae bacterium]